MHRNLISFADNSQMPNVSEGRGKQVKSKKWKNSYLKICGSRLHRAISKPRRLQRILRSSRLKVNAAAPGALPSVTCGFSKHSLMFSFLCAHHRGESFVLEVPLLPLSVRWDFGRLECRESGKQHSKEQDCPHTVTEESVLP